MIEERDAHLERVRHRGPVEVVEHVVDEPELRVEVERARKRLVRSVRGHLPDGALRRFAVELGERAAHELRAEGVVEVAARREQARGRVGSRHRTQRALE